MNEEYPNSDEFRNTSEPGNGPDYHNVWVPDESTLGGKTPAEQSKEETADKAAFAGSKEEPVREFHEQPKNPFSAPPRSRTKRQKKHCGTGTVVKWCLAGAACLMLMFSTVTSAFLLHENLTESRHVSQVTAPVEQSESNSQGAVSQTADSGSTLSVAEINNKVSASVVLIKGENLTGQGQGSGFIINSDGYIVTNAHVVSGFNNITVTLNNEEKSEYPATVVGADSYSDVAVVKIQANGLTAAELGTSSNLQVGENVVVIGNPLGEEFTGSVTTGIISALNRKVTFEDGQTFRYIQTDAAINTGNSGGPLVNMQGQVIGINSAKIDNSVAEGMGFAIPIDDAVSVINDLIDCGYVKGRPYIGISGETLGEQYTAFYDLPEGVHITSIDQKSPAADTELQVDDIITAVNGTEISTMGELNEIKNQSAPGDKLELTVYRYSTKKTFTVNLTLAEMTPEMQ